MRDRFADLPNEVKQAHFDQLNTYTDQLRKKPELRSLFLEMTLRCNERCLHCGSDAGIPPAGKALTDYELLQTLIQLRTDLAKQQRRLPFLNVTGGEPLLRPHLPELMKTLRTLGYRWGMTSNGLLITPDMAQRLRDADMYSIGLSLDGLQETHDWFRRTAGAYAGALQALDNLLAAGQAHVMVTTVVHKRSIGELDAIYEVLREHGCTDWRIISMEPIGRALDHPELMLSPEDHRYIIQYIMDRQDDPHMNLLYSCNHYLGLERERKTRGWYYFCRAGLQVASIQFNGDISACLDIERRPELTFGNVRNDRLLERWDNGFAIYRTHKENTSDKCAVCEHKKNCQGGGWHTWDFARNRPRICMLEQLGDLPFSE